MSPWLFDIFMNACTREMKAKVWNVGARVNNGMNWVIVACLFAAAVCDNIE